MKAKVVYINTRTNQGVETVDEMDFNTKEERKEAKRVLGEYNMAFDTYCYFSNRCTKYWRNKK